MHACSAPEAHGELLQSRGGRCGQRLSARLSETFSCHPAPLYHIKELTRSLRSNYLTWLLALTAEGESCLQRLHSQTRDIIIDAAFKRELNCEESVCTPSFAVRICCIVLANTLVSSSCEATTADQYIVRGKHFCSSNQEKGRGSSGFCATSCTLSLKAFSFAASTTT